MAYGLNTLSTLPQSSARDVQEQLHMASIYGPLTSCFLPRLRSMRTRWGTKLATTYLGQGTPVHVGAAYVEVLLVYDPQFRMQDAGTQDAREVDGPDSGSTCRV